MPQPLPQEQLRRERRQTILVVEDESGVRGIIRYILAREKYQVLVASNGEEAIRLSACYEGAIDLLLTDVVMPGMSGRTVAERLSEIRPGIKIVYMSGYTDDAALRYGVAISEFEFLHKPFTQVELLEKVRAALGKDPR